MANIKKSTRLRQLIDSNELEFIIEAHNGLSAKIVEEAGFKGIWGSGLSISAALGVRDNNEASWTQVLEVCEFMSDATSIPILLDGDTGFGNFNSFRRLVRKLEQRDIAGVCIEDKIFPKTNSFIGGEKQPLADIEEFCGKIRSGKNYQLDPDFVIVARVEAFIAGWGLEEALTRARAYADAGADAILVHSKIDDDSQIRAFMERWDNRKPVIIVPTMYYKIPTDNFRNCGISLAIWANHTMRAAITSMQAIVGEIYEQESLVSVQEKIVPVKEIFRLQNIQEYKEAESRYLPQNKTFRGIVLAATKGSNFGSLTEDKPKAMIRIGEETILSRLVSTFNNRGIKDISVVVGFHKEAVDLPNLKYIDNDQFSEYGLLYSIYTAREALSGDVVLSFGDILFEGDILEKLMHCDNDIVLGVDTAHSARNGRMKDLIRCEKPYSEAFGARNITPVLEISEKSDNSESDSYNGEFIGLIRFTDRGSRIFRDELETLARENSELLYQGSLNDFINHLVKKNIGVHAKYFRGQWKDIDSIEDLTYLIQLFAQGDTI